MKNRAVLVTGASGGIGAAICEAFAEVEAKIIGVDRIPSAWTQGLSLDLEDPNLFDELDQRFDTASLTTVVHAAAAQVFGRVHEVDTRVWQETFFTNVLAANSLVSNYRQQLIANRGSVVVVGSVHAIVTREGIGVYGVSKAALEAWVRVAAIELAPQVRVNSVIPGAIESGSLRELLESTQAVESSLRAKIDNRTPLGRVGNPEEIAAAVFFLASNSASFITGQNLVVDGGATLLLATEVT